MMMRRELLLSCAVALALAATAGTARAVAIPSTSAQTCADQIELRTRNYVKSVQTRIRNSIKNNTKAVDSKCAAGFACSGGAGNGNPCNPANGNSDCVGIAQCAPKIAPPGVAGHINNAKGLLRSKIIQFCTNADLLLLYGVDGSSRCPDPDSPDNGLDTDEIADCILGGATGDIAGARFGSTEGDVMGRGANEIVPDSPTAPIAVCGVPLGSILQTGSESSYASVGEAGGAAPLAITGCMAGVCDTEGVGVIGNYLNAPTQTFAGTIPICLVTVTGNSGNGTPQDGTITIGGGSVGQQTSFAPIFTTVLIGTTCPSCDVINHVCDSGVNAGQPCTSAGGTDTACPPTIVGVPPLIANPLDLDTEPNSISVPPNSPGAGSTNPSQTFCGACDFDDTIGCDNDADCIAEGVCGAGFGLGCCQFGANTGAFGDDLAKTVSANGVRGPYMPKLATIFCTGKTGSALVDSTQGLPGPARLVQEQLNTFEW